MKIEILGMGCAKCQALYENARTAVRESGRDAQIVKVEDLDKMADYGVMVTPALIIDGQAKSAGKVLTAEEIKKMLGRAGDNSG